MSERFVVRNQLGHFWGKGKAWVDGTEPRTILLCAHEDEAVNTLFELSSRDIALRGEVQAVALSDKGEPVVEPSEHRLPKAPKPGKAQAGADTANDPDATSEEIARAQHDSAAPTHTDTAAES